MPGITGIISKHITHNEEDKLDIMINSMLHESFYTHDTYINKELGFYIGFVSLENSFSDCMPIYNEKKDIILFLTGECYLDKSVIDGLAARGHKFNPENASFLIHLYEEQGDNFFRDLNGWHNGLILDLRKQEAILFNDRYGIRRVYYHESNEAFIFSSEAKSLLKAFPSLRNLNLKSIGEYLVYDCVLKNCTYFSDIYLLPPCSAWHFVKGNVDKKSYFDPSSLENQSNLSTDKFIEELSGTFKEILPRYFSGESIGMSLTGGLDTRSIMACRNPVSGELPCYTFGGTYRDIMDVRIAPRVAKACNQTHQVLTLDDDKYLTEYPFHVKTSMYISDGLVAVNTADLIYFSKLARQIAPIRMTGIYGSQVLKSISGLIERPPYEQLINHDFKKFLSKAKETFSSIEKLSSLSSMLFNEISWWWNGFLSTQSTQLTVRSPYLDYDFIKVLYKAPSRKLDFGVKFQLALIRECNQKLMKIPTTGTYGGGSSLIISNLIKNYINLLLIFDKIHIRERLPYNMTHWIGRIDYLLSKIHASKHLTGFADYRRYRVWYRDQLSDYLKNTLLNSRTYNRPYWNKNYLQKIVHDHTNGHGTYLREIRKVLQVEMINRVLIEEI